MRPHLVTVVHRDLRTYPCRDWHCRETMLRPYADVIDNATGSQLVTALAGDDDFAETLVTRGILTEEQADAFIEGDEHVASVIENDPDATVEAREYLHGQALPHVHSRDTSTITIAGINVSIAGGLTADRRPFPGFTAVSSLAALMDAEGLGVR